MLSLISSSSSGPKIATVFQPYNSKTRISMIYHKYSWLLSAVIKIPYGSLSLHICRFQQLPHASHSEQSEYLPLSSARSVHPFPKQCSSARQDNSSVHNISGQFRRCLSSTPWTASTICPVASFSATRISSEVSFTFSEVL